MLSSFSKPQTFPVYSTMFMTTTAFNLRADSGEGNREMVEMEVCDTQGPAEQDSGVGNREMVEMEVCDTQGPEQDQEERLQFLLGEADSGEGNREMVEMEVLDVQAPEQDQEEQSQFLPGEAAQDQVEKESREECQPGPDEHLDPSKDALDAECDHDKSGCDTLQTATDEASFADGALEYDTKL